MPSVARCPVCRGGLRRLKYRCERCGAIVGDDVDQLDSLDGPMRRFAIEYIVCRGSVRGIAYDLGMPIAQVEANVDELVRSLDDGR